MRSVIVTISGYPRTGKDTFAHDLAASLNKSGVNDVHKMSSVDIVREMVDRAVSVVGFAKTDYTDGLGWPNVYRNMLADIKAILDRDLLWTPNMAITRAMGLSTGSVILYQVREPRNIELLRLRARSQNIGLLPVLVTSSSDMAVNGRVEASDHEKNIQYLPNDFDLVVNNTEWETLSLWVTLARQLIENIRNS